MILQFLGVWLIVPLSMIVYFFGRTIHRNEYRYYVGVLLLTVILSVFVLLDVNLWVFQELIIEGHLSFALFVLVMFGGAFPLRSKPKKYLMQIRREFALMGFLLLIPHGLYRLSLALNGYNFTGVWAFIIMIPLVIVSYPKVRKRIQSITWKRVHKMAYVVYFFIYIHVGFDLFISDTFRRFVVDWDAWPYHLVFIVYLILKIRVILLQKGKKVIS